MRSRESLHLFYLGCFYFFLRSISQIRESQHELGPIAFLQRGPQLGDDPVAHLRTPSTSPTLRRPAATMSTDLNQDLNIFWSRNERAESKWDLDSRNVDYGIFRATPKKRAK
jgi:hypothetical protein